MKIEDLKTITTEEEARQKAIDWQAWSSEQSLSYGELAAWAAAFEELAKKWPDLTDEYVENGIISEPTEKISEDDALARYDEHLDEIYTPYNIGVLEFAPSRVLKELDPTAYRTGFNDWLDSEDLELED